MSAGDVEEAIRLTRMSKSSLIDDDDDQQDGSGGARDDISKIYMLIRDYMMQHKLTRYGTFCPPLPSLRSLDMSPLSFRYLFHFSCSCFAFLTPS